MLQIDTRIKFLGRRQVVVAGTETHVCVMQTALGLLSRNAWPDKREGRLRRELVGSHFDHADLPIAIESLISCLA